MQLTEEEKQLYRERRDRIRIEKQKDFERRENF
jgi:hypothetical protein